VYGKLQDDEVAWDYLQLLRRGSVTRKLAVAQHPLWRRGIRAKARGDELRVRTWSREQHPATVWAVLSDWSLNPEERAELQRRVRWLRED